MQTEKKIFNARPLFYGFLSLLLAIASTRFLFSGNFEYVILVSVLFVLFIAFCIWKNRFVTLIVVVATFLFGIGWYFVGVTTFQGNVYSETCTVVGRVSDDLKFYSYYENSTAYATLKDVEINGNREKNISLKVDLQTQAELQIGDVITFEAEVENIKLFELGAFYNGNYRDDAPYFVHIGIADITKTGNELTFDEQVRLAVKDGLYQNMGETYGSVAYAVLFGNKDFVENEIKDAFKMAGVIHILTVSGLHVSFLIALIGFILKKCRVRGWLNFVICAVFLVVYAYLCGFAPSIMRAGIMGLVLLTTKISGKCYDKLNSLGLSGIIILLINPLSALDIGFLMSFFCVLGIFVISPWLSKILKRIFPKTVAESFSISIGASICILPFMASMFGYLNFLSIFANLIIIPIFSVVYPLLFVFAFLVALLPWLGFMLTACKFGLLAVYKISEFFACTNLATELVPINIFSIATLFIALFLLSRYSMFAKRSKAICCSSLLVLSLVFSLVDILQQPSVGIAYCFNYSNDSVMLTNSQGKTAVVDFDSKAENLMSVCNVKQVSTIFILDYYVNDIEFMREVGVQNIISCKNYRNYDEEVLVNKNLTYQIDGFEFAFKSFDGKMVALELKFDNVSVLILSDDADALHAQSFAQNNYDFVMIGSNSELAKCFSAGCIVQGYEKGENVDKNYLHDGNSFYKIKESKFVWRCLD